MILGTVNRGHLISSNLKVNTKYSLEWKLFSLDLENHTHAWLSLRQAGNMKKCLKFSKDVNVYIFMITQKPNSIGSVKCYKFLNLMCLYLCIWKRSIWHCGSLLHSALAVTCRGRESSLAGFPAHLSVPSPPQHQLSTREVCTGLRKLSCWHASWTYNVFVKKSSPFQSCPSFRIKVLNFQEV